MEKLKANLTLLGFLAILFSGYFIVEAVFGKKESKPPVVAWDSVKDEPEQKIPFGMVIGVLGQEGSWIEKFSEEKFNIDIKPEFVHGATFSQQRQLRLISGQIPDIFQTHGTADLESLKKSNLIIEIPPAIFKKYAPSYVKFINEIDPTAWLSVQVDGKIYALPRIYTAGLFPRPGVWRKDWLEKVGISKVPDNLVEMEEALRRIRFDDPDGNGKMDTYGMSGDVSEWWWISFSEIFGAYGILPYDWMERDGKIVYGGILPEAKEALKLLQRWHKEGLIDPEFLTDSGGYGMKGCQQKFLNGKLGYIYYFGRYDFLDESNPTSFISKLKALQPGAEIAVGKFPSGPNGLRGARIQGGPTATYSFSKNIAKRPELVIRILKIQEQIFNDEELAVTMALGKRGKHWDFFSKDSGKSNSFEMLLPYNDSNSASKELIGGQLYSPNFMNFAGNSVALWFKYMPPESRKFMQEHRQLKYGMQNALGRPEYVPGAESYFNDLRLFQKTAYAKIISGEKPLDYFDEFREQWLDRGGTKLLKNANQFYRTRNKLYQEMGVKK